MGYCKSVYLFIFFLPQFRDIRNIKSPLYLTIMKVKIHSFKFAERSDTQNKWP